MESANKLNQILFHLIKSKYNYTCSLFLATDGCSDSTFDKSFCFNGSWSTSGIEKIVPRWIKLYTKKPIPVVGELQPTVSPKQQEHSDHRGIMVDNINLLTQTSHQQEWSHHCKKMSSQSAPTQLPYIEFPLTVQEFYIFLTGVLQVLTFWVPKCSRH